MIFSSKLQRTQLWYRQTLYTLILTVLLGVLLSVFTIALDLIDEQEATKAEALRITNAVSKQASQAVFNIDAELAKRVAESLNANPLLREVVIFDDINDVLAIDTKPVHDSFLSNLADVLFHTQEPIVVPVTYPNSDTTLGYIQVWLNEGHVADQFFIRALRTLVGSFLRNIALSFCLLVLFYYTLTKPLMQIAAQIEAIDTEKPDNNLQVGKRNQSDELGSMTNSLNQLLSRFKSLHRQRDKLESELKEHNNVLEKLVDVRTKELEEANKQLLALLSTDHLTGSLTRRSFEELAVRQLNYAERDGLSVSLMMFDLDKFKQVNDTHGHLFGDSVLRQFATLTQAILKKNDLFARYGGEEFVLLQIGASRQEAVEIADKIRETFNSHKFTHKGADHTFSVSIGLLTTEDVAAIDLNQLISQADKQLYQAKQKGRNQVVVCR